MGVEVRPSLESNGLRVLARLGKADGALAYGGAYRQGVDALRREGPLDRDGLIDAWSRLRAHGKTLCRRNAPDCLACPLDPDCAHAAADKF